MKARRAIAMLAAAVVAGSAAPAQAAVVIGQAPPTSGTSVQCNSTNVQVSTTAGPDYRVPPGGGVITEWRHAATNTTASAGLIVVGEDISGLHATTVALTDAVPLTPNQLNTFAARIPVAGGERIGIAPAPTTIPSCYYNTMSSTDQHIFTSGRPAVGTSPPYSTFAGRVNMAAVIEPDEDKDAFGDESQDSCPVDGSTQGPCAAVIDRGPKKKTKSRKATFLFSVPAGQNITFECALDKQDFTPCESPRKLTKLKVRKHKFQVRAKDAAGNVGLPAVQRWRVID